MQSRKCPATFRAMAMVGVLLLGACSGGGASKEAGNPTPNTPSITITLVGVPPTVTYGANLVMTAQIQGSTSTSVTWTVDNIANGNASVGTITGTGSTVTYVAPTNSGNHVLAATSVSDPTKSASAQVAVVPPATISSVVVAPGVLALNTGSQGQFSAAVTGTGSYSTAVTWTSQRGTVSSTGLYTAPASAGSDVVTATSVVDASRSASASVTVQAAAGVGVALTPSSAISLNAGGTASVTATVSGSSNTAVTWTVDGVAGGNGTVGTVTGTGSTVTYVAPVSAGTHTVKATSVADASRSASVVVTVQSSSSPAGVIVAPNGVAGNAGTLAAPTTLAGAQALIQKAIKNGAVNPSVWLRGGIYPSASLSLGSADSGTASNPVQWAAYPGETPRLVGGVSLSPTALRLVDSTDPNWSRLDASARSLIYVADLSAYKSSLGSLASRSDASQQNQAMEVFVDGKPMTLARYPKAVDASAVNLAPQATIRVTGTITPDATGDYAYKGLDGRGRPYYQLSKNGDVWSIAGSPTGPEWSLSNRKDLGGKGTASWGNWETFRGPAGKFSSGSGASGSAFLDPADGSTTMPGFLLIRGTNGTTQITAPDARMSRWKASEAMYYGFGWYCWSGSHSPLTSLDPVSGTFTLSGSPNYGLRTGQPFFIYNLLEELTAPGDYFIDTINAKLYLRPMGDVAPGEVLLSTVQTPMVQMYGANYVTWQGVVFEGTKDRLVIAQDCQGASFKNCTFRNAGGYGLLLRGYNNLVEACDFRQLGKGGIWVSGGDRAALKPSGTVIENSEFQQFGRVFWTYQPAVYVQSFGDWAYNNDCMGFTIQHNEIHHSPHAGLIYSGSSNTIQYNHIHDVTQWANDAGAIYTTGRDWGTQGNSIQYNLIRNCGQTAFGWSLVGIYIDGIGSGVTIEGNILYNAAPWCAIEHNGGRDVKTRYNVFYGSSFGLDLENVAFHFANNTAGSTWNLLEKIQHFNYQSGAWATAYPTVAAIPSSWSSLQNSHWLEAENSVLYGNLQFGPSPDVYRQGEYASASLKMGTPISYFAQVESNLSQVDPQFTDPANLDFRLKASSPMFAVPGFPGIDTTKIGIQR